AEAAQALFLLALAAELHHHHPGGFELVRVQDGRLVNRSSSEALAMVAAAVRANTGLRLGNTCAPPLCELALLGAAPYQPRPSVQSLRARTYPWWYSTPFGVSPDILPSSFLHSSPPLFPC
ncbi:unnamed protein product, partial [Ectocarpus sp. 12 AP-2014]